MDSVDALVVGAGVTGIYQLHRLVEEGFSARLLEAGDGVGGTWFWNRYPGARFDSESYTYAYLHSRELFDSWEWPELFAGQPDIERYFNHVVDRFDLRRHMRFGAAVTSAVWDDAARQWEVTDATGAVTSARWLISSTGVLSVPVFPDVPGRETFRGEQHHNARWPVEPLDLRGRRVAVVGTGSSGVQIVPVIADEVAELTVYQRTANWCTPLNNGPISPAEQARLREGFEQMREVLNTSNAGFLHPAHDRGAFDDSPEEREAFFESMWSSPGFSKLTSNYIDLLFDEKANAEWCDFIVRKIHTIVSDPVTADRLTPKGHRYGEHRPPFVTGYYETFNRPNVHLVDLLATPMLRVTETGIETAEGLVELDVIIWATGFDFGTGALLRMGIVGRDGLSLNDHWADGPTTFLGIQTTRFPNLFFPGGPHAAAGNNPRYNGDQVDFVTDLLLEARSRGAEVVEVSPEAERSWTAMVDRGAGRQPSFGTASYYFGSNIKGKPQKYLLNSAGRPKLLSMIAEEKAGGWPDFEMSCP